MKYINNLDEAINLYGKIDKQIVGNIIHDVSILTHCYGLNDLNCGKGGCVILTFHLDDFKLIEKDFKFFATLAPEFEDEIICEDGSKWTHLLFLYTDDFAISIYKKIKSHYV